MADPSRPPTFKAYGITTPAHCPRCGQRLTYDTPGGLWFRGNDPNPGDVFCFRPDCVKEAAKA